MGTTSTKLNYLNQTKNLIAQAIRGKGVEVDTNSTFRSYANKIRQINAIVVGGGDATNEIDLILVGGYNCMNTLQIDNLINGNYMFRRSS